VVDGTEVGDGDIAQVAPVRYALTGGGLTCGYELGPAIGLGYRAPFAFTGTIDHVVIDTDGDVHRDLEGEFDAIMAEQ
jgi:hypothetical protein